MFVCNIRENKPRLKGHWTFLIKKQLLMYLTQKTYMIHLVGLDLSSLQFKTRNHDVDPQKTSTDLLIVVDIVVADCCCLWLLIVVVDCCWMFVFKIRENKLRLKGLTFLFTLFFSLSIFFPEKDIGQGLAQNLSKTLTIPRD